ncbi:hypothetical protein PIB30_081156, partial [Stylosanthes scabra]|nr:hypothetical protein [Stylosanthes scabra]
QLEGPSTSSGFHESACMRQRIHTDFLQKSPLYSLKPVIRLDGISGSWKERRVDLQEVGQGHRPRLSGNTPVPTSSLLSMCNIHSGHPCLYGVHHVGQSSEKPSLLVVRFVTIVSVVGTSSTSCGSYHQGPVNTNRRYQGD